MPAIVPWSTVTAEGFREDICPCSALLESQLGLQKTGRGASVKCCAADCDETMEPDCYLRVETMSLILVPSFPNRYCEDRDRSSEVMLSPSSPAPTCFEKKNCSREAGADDAEQYMTPAFHRGCF